jgi:uncharacterized protein YkwD
MDRQDTKKQGFASYTTQSLFLRLSYQKSLFAMLPIPIKILLFLCLLWPLGTTAQYSFPEWEAETYQAAHTARETSYLSDNEKEIIRLINLARLDGKLFARTYVRKYADEKGMKNSKPVKTLIEDLQKTPSLIPYQPDESLTKAARKHAQYMGSKGKTGHIGKGGKNPAQRVEEYIHWDIWIAENIQYGSDNPIEVVLRLLIDEKVPNLAHRKNLLAPQGRYIGVASEPHKVYGSNCVMELTGGFR